MADNVVITPGTGATIAADEVSDGTLGSVKVQYVKIMDGTLDGTTKAVVNSNGLKVDGSAATQPISAASLPLPTGAATLAKQPALGTAGTASSDVITIQGIASMTAVKVDNSAVTQPVSAASLPLPSGASTAAKQPALGTAGSASSDVISIQGVASMTAVKVDGSAVTQPVSIASVPSHAVTNAGTFAVQAASAGDVASGSSDSGNPVKGGGLAKTANPTAVTDGQRVASLHDKLGKQVVVNSIRDLKGIQKTTITSSTTETTVVTAVASTFLDVYGLIVTNTSATLCGVTFKDSTTGTTRFIIEVPANDTRGFMLTESAAIPQATVNNNWTATCDASVASIEITALYVKNI